MRLWAENIKGWGYPFRRITLKARTKCRFCEWKADKEISRIQDKQGLDFDPRADHPIKTGWMMAKGQEALEVVTAGGRNGTFWVCIPCGKQLLDNLTAELEK